jgi:hypothetical protein
MAAHIAAYEEQIEPDRRRTGRQGRVSDRLRLSRAMCRAAEGQPYAVDASVIDQRDARL